MTACGRAARWTRTKGGRDGLKLQGCGPGLVVARAAIIAAAEALDSDDECTLWASFSRRGLGFSAVQGTTNRNDNTEAFDTHPDCRRGFLPPVTGAYGTLTEVDAGDAVALRFTADGLQAAGRPQGQRLAVLAQGGLHDAAGAELGSRVRDAA